MTLLLAASRVDGIAKAVEVVDSVVVVVAGAAAVAAADVFRGECLSSLDKPESSRGKTSMKRFQRS